jgi:hypothetical protein
VPGAFFCHGCGLRLDVAVAELDVFAPLSSTPQGYAAGEPTGERLKTALGVVAVLALVALAVVYIGSVDPDPTTDDATADATDLTDATDAEGATEDVEPPEEVIDHGADLVANDAGRLGKHSQIALGEGWPISALRHNGEAMAFVAPRSSYLFTEVGLDLWVGPDFDQLTKVPLVLPTGVEVADVALVDDRLLAVGSDESGELAAWRSDDGRRWVDEALPGPEPRLRRRWGSDGDWSISDSEILVGEAGVGVLVSRHHDSYIEIMTTAFDHFGLPVDELGSFQVYEDFESVSLAGPFGFIFATVETERLELNEPRFDEEPPPMTWLFNDGDGWVWQQFETPWLQSSGVDHEGNFFAMEWRDNGPKLLRSSDGVTWTETAVTGEINSIIPWGDGLLTASQTDLGVTIDGDLDRLGMREIAPPGSESGSYFGLQSGADGVFVAWQSWDRGPAGPASASLLKDGYALSSDDGWALELRRDGDIVWSTEGQPAAEKYAADIDRRAIILLDPDTGDPLVEFLVEELDQLVYQSNNYRKSISDRVLFSYDLEDWYGGLIGTFDEPASVWHEGGEFIDDQLAVFTHGEGDHWGNSSPLFELWVFDLPSDGSNGG